MSLSKTTIRILPETIRLIKLTDEEYFSPKYKDYISRVLNSKRGTLLWRMRLILLFVPTAVRKMI